MSAEGMPSSQLLWVLVEERRNQARDAARERLARDAGRREPMSIGPLRRLRDRFRTRRHGAIGQPGWSAPR